MARLSPEDHALVTAAVAKAELSSDGEIVTIVAGRSDAYHDVALHYSVLALLLVAGWSPARSPRNTCCATTRITGWAGRTRSRSNSRARMASTG